MNKNLINLFFLLIISFTSCENSKKADPKIDVIITEELNSILNENLGAEKRKKIIDSIYKDIPNLKNDSLRNKILIRISYEYLKLNDSIAFKESNRKARKISMKLRDSIGLAATFWDLGNYYYKHNIADSAYYYYDNAQELYSSLKNNYFSARMLLNMAIIQKNIKDYTGSEKTTIKALTLLKPLDKYNQLYAAYNNLGIIFDELEEYDKSLFYYEKALKCINESEISKKTPAVLNNIGVVLDKKDEHENAIDYFDKALEFRDLLEEDLQLYAMLLDNRAYAKFHLGDTTDIHQELIKSLRIREELNLESGITINQLHLAEYYLYKKDTSKALSYARDTREISLKNNNSRDLLASLELLSNISSDSALVYSRKYIKINDSLYKNERAIRNKFTRIRFETNEYISETEKLNQRILLISLISLGILLVSVLLYIINDQKSKNKFIKQKQSANQEIYNLILAQQRNFEEGREEEKQHISRELHDGILGRLFGVRLSLDSLNDDDDIESKKKRFCYIEEIQDIAEEVRLISHRLNKSSLIDVNFRIVLEELIRKQPQKIQLEIDNSIKWNRIENNIKINFYRIIQEGMNNIYKHAKASVGNVEISKDVKNTLVLKIWDNGVGFNEEQLKGEGIGFGNMKSRSQNMKGSFSIKSDFEGTLIEVKVNIKQ